MTSPHPKVDDFIQRAKAWSSEMNKLRSILLDCGLDEDIKWGKPCYSTAGKNVAIIQPFKAHCSLMFFKGVLLKDTHGLLRSQGKDTQSARRLEFRSAVEVKKGLVQDYVKQAIAVEQAGTKVAFKAKDQLDLPEELREVFKRDRKLERAFAALTPGRQRGYVLHFNGAKQSATRSARIAKCAPLIMAGHGLHER